MRAFASLQIYLSLIVLWLVAGCDEFSYEGWLNKPIGLALEQDIPLLPIRFAGGENQLCAVDTASPYSVMQMSGNGQLVTGDLRLQDALYPEVTRFKFPKQQVLDLSLSPIGLNNQISIAGIIGAPLLSSFAIHLSYASSASITLLDEIPDSSAELAADCPMPIGSLLSNETTSTNYCIGAFNASRRGGGRINIDDQLVDIPPTRLVLPLCLMPDMNLFTTTNNTQPVATVHGVPAMGVLATGLGTSIISRTAWTRLRTANPNLAGETTGQTLYLPTGEESVSRVVIPSLAVVADEAYDLGPCSELARRVRLAQTDPAMLLAQDEEKLGASAAVLNQTNIEFIIVEDNSPLIEGLRQELRPAVPDIDILLGGSFLKSFKIDIDYPGNRVLLQCQTRPANPGCTIIPWCGYNTEPRCQVWQMQK